jgi:hypothetical protein
MARTVEDPDFPCDAPPPIAGILPPINRSDPHYRIVGRCGTVWRLHRRRVDRIVSDGSGRITEISFTPEE